MYHLQLIRYHLHFLKLQLHLIRFQFHLMINSMFGVEIHHSFEFVLMYSLMKINANMQYAAFANTITVIQESTVNDLQIKMQIETSHYAIMTWISLNLFLMEPYWMTYTQLVLIMKKRQMYHHIVKYAMNLLLAIQGEFRVNKYRNNYNSFQNI